MKRTILRIGSLVLAGALSMSALSVTAMAGNTPSSWAAGQVNEAISYGLIPESVQGNYTAPITRQEFAEVMEELAHDYSGKGTYEYWDNYNSNVPKQPFTDTDNEKVRKMYAFGVMSGIGDGKFGPDQPLTREQAATIMVNFGKAVKKPLPSGNVNFSDSGNISAWAKEGVGSVQAAGIMSGVGNNCFAPKDYYTREQSIVAAFKLYKYVKGMPVSGGGNSSGSNTLSGSFQSDFQKIYSNLSTGIDNIEIANATDRELPSSDEFIKIDGNALRSKYPDKSTAIGYLEAARSEMIDAGVCGVDIWMAGQMGYTNSYYNKKVSQSRIQISEHVENARRYLQKADAAK